MANFRINRLLLYNKSSILFGRERKREKEGGGLINLNHHKIRQTSECHFKGEVLILSRLKPSLTHYFLLKMNTKK